jgi:hypothetical protein
MVNNFSLDFEFNSCLEEHVKNIEKGMGKVNESPLPYQFFLEGFYPFYDRS